jgi:hypothetical protein
VASAILNHFTSVLFVARTGAISRGGATFAAAVLLRLESCMMCQFEATRSAAILNKRSRDH